MNLLNYRVVEILWGAFYEVARNWQPLLRALVLPAAGSGIVIILWANFAGPTTAPWLFLAARGMLYTLFATSCHRIILLGPKSLPNEWGIYWTIRETRFLGWLILVGIVFLFVSWPLGFVVLYIPPNSGMLWMHWYLIVFVWAFVQGRLCLVLPATATDRTMNIEDSWNLTRGNGFVIAIAIFVVAFIMDMIDYAIGLAAGPGAPIAADVLAEVFVFPMVAVAVGVLSVTYRILTKQDVQE